MKTPTVRSRAKPRRRQRIPALQVNHLILLELVIPKTLLNRLKEPGVRLGQTGPVGLVIIMDCIHLDQPNL